jgi:hypothetical protein
LASRIKNGLACSVCSVLTGLFPLVVRAGSAIAPSSIEEEPKPCRDIVVYWHEPDRSTHFGLAKKLDPIWWLGNSDDKQPPRTYMPGKCGRRVAWFFRNPLHNFTFYVIGMSDKTFSRVGPFPTETRNPFGGWNWALSRCGPIGMPFVDYKGRRFEFYFGWRTDGNFGIKINFKKPKPPPRPGPPP